MGKSLMDNKWFAQYCNLCAANVLDREGQVRFTYEQLHTALNDLNNQVPEPILELQRNIINACNKQFGVQDSETDMPLILTLLNIHAAYLMMTGVWKEEPKETSEYGFEIF